VREMTSRNLAPKAIVFDRTNTILAQGAAFAELSMVDRFERGDPTTLIRTGDELEIAPPKAASPSSTATLSVPGCARYLTLRA
jgi:predicted aconitase with swiveling domain